MTSPWQDTHSLNCSQNKEFCSAKHVHLSPCPLLAGLLASDPPIFVFRTIQAWLFSPLYFFADAILQTRRSQHTWLSICGLSSTFKHNLASTGARPFAQHFNILQHLDLFLWLIDVGLETSKRRTVDISEKTANVTVPSLYTAANDSTPNNSFFKWTRFAFPLRETSWE